MVKFTIIVNEELIIDENINKFRNKLLNEISKNTKVIFQKNTPKDSGRSANNYKIIKRENEHEIRNDEKHLVWVNNGTGVYGPHHHRIVPKNARVLHFNWKGKEWFLKSVKGQKGQKFVEQSMSEVMNSVGNAVIIAKQGTLE